MLVLLSGIAWAEPTDTLTREQVDALVQESRERQKRSRKRRLAFGGAAVVVGAIVTGGTAAYVSRDPLLTQDSWNMVVLTNAAGWGLVFGGATTMVTTIPAIDGPRR